MVKSLLEKTKRDEEKNSHAGTSYPLDKDSDEGDIPTRSSGITNIGEPDNTKTSSEPRKKPDSGKDEKYYPQVYQNVMDFLDCIEEQVEDGETLSDHEVDKALTYARAGFQDESYKVLLQNYKNLDQDQLEHSDALNLMLIEAYAQDQNNVDINPDQVDSLLRPYFSDLELPQEFINVIREEYFPDSLSYSAVSQALDEIEETLPESEFIQENYSGQELEEVLNQEKNLYLQVSRDRMNSSHVSPPDETPPLAADGGASQGFINQVAGRTVDYLSPKVKEAVSNLRIKKQLDEIAATTEEHSSQISDLQDGLAEYTDVVETKLEILESGQKSFKESIAGLEDVCSEIQEDMSAIEGHTENLEEDVSSISQKTESIDGKFEERTEQLVDGLASVDRRTEDLRQAVGTNTERLEQLDETTGQLEQTVASVDQRTESLESDLSSVEEKTDEIDNKLDVILDTI